MPSKTTVMFSLSLLGDFLAVITADGDPDDGNGEAYMGARHATKTECQCIFSCVQADYIGYENP